MLSERTIQELTNTMKEIDEIDFNNLNKRVVKELQTKYKTILTILRRLNK